MKCQHCGYKLIDDEGGWHHIETTWYRRDEEVCYENQIYDLRNELLEAKERIKELEKICNNGP